MVDTLYVETGYVDPLYAQTGVIIIWATKVIYVPRIAMTLVQSTPNVIYELDIPGFHLTLKDLEDDEEGIVFPYTHNNFPPVSVGGVTLARVLEIVAPYTVTFEDGQYSVNLVGGNNNISDRNNRNLVSINSTNSAGLIVTGGSDLTAAEIATAVVNKTTSGAASGSIGDGIGKALKKSDYLGLS